MFPVKPVVLPSLLQGLKGSNRVLRFEMEKDKHFAGAYISIFNTGFNHISKRLRDDGGDKTTILSFDCVGAMILDYFIKLHVLKYLFNDRQREFMRRFLFTSQSRPFDLLTLIVYAKFSPEAAKGLRGTWCCSACDAFSKL